ncbi:polyphosphate kinase 1 [Zophobihabitans entericus]|uniref:Polyphosphate kinase n=1 Tax=Zophobihabitans entericus TaxID=1635327 RepID=A0A6G9ICY4_9GAMM|nr:polyphosphate kinase 1 [Zophobihabitans entericus]QIQ22096.1 polyphosphate kinase 1 [Zophobihabitans entericus]
MNQENVYLKKELSWLAFNERVLQESADQSTPLIERIRFLGIYANNLDEFYKVQFADLKRTVLINQEQGNSSGSSQLLKQVQQRVMQSEVQFEALYNELLLEMARNQIFLVNERQLTSHQEEWIRLYFKQNLRQYITPILLDSYTDLIQFLKDDFSYLAVEIINGTETKYALLEIPSDKVSRFVLLPSSAASKNKSIIFLDNILRYCLSDIFKIFFDATEFNAYSIKITRDAEYDIIYELDASFLDLMSLGLKQRLTAEPVRFIYQKNMPKELIELLMRKLKISAYDAIPGGRYPNFKDLMHFPSLGRPNLLNKPLPPLSYQRFKKFRNAFDTIREQDVLLYYPYYSFEHVLEIMRQASFDPNVTQIRINIYRVAKDSRIVNAMINAANNGKKVMVVVELQARFDEQANIHWAKRLTESGVKVIFSPTRLKIHAKLFLIDRRENGEIVRYAHVGSGNFNEKTARLYTDFSLLTADPNITAEVRKVFNFIEEPYKPVTFEHLLVSPQNTRDRLYYFIQREIDNAAQGNYAAIRLKINSLTDQGLIDKLYEASRSGVKIRIVCRGMCVLVPGIADLSENIVVTSIVDRFLEHARVYIFENGGEQDTYISSADWMPRNIDGRIEVGVKVVNPALKKVIHDIFSIQTSDNVKARIIDKEFSNKYVQRGNKRKVRAQLAIYDYLKQRESDPN